MLHWDIFASFKFYFTIGWSQRWNDTSKFDKLNELFKTCRSALLPFFRNIATRCFSVISTPIKISQFPKKNLIAPTSGIPKRFRTSKSVQNYKNERKNTKFKAKKTTCNMRTVTQKKLGLASFWHSYFLNSYWDRVTMLMIVIGAFLSM